MIIVKLYGGLGNQMFQYAFAYVLSIKWDDIVVVEKGFFEKNQTSYNTAVKRSFDLDVFKLNYKEISKQKLDKLFERRHSKFWKRVPFIKHLKLIRESHFGYHESFIHTPPPLCLDGYFQSEKYFLGYKEEIKSLFKFPHDLLTEGEQNQAFKLKENPNAVSIHVRRGDYISDNNNNSFHGICSVDYYKKAMEYFKAKEPNAEFYLFTDSPELVKKEFENIANINLVSGVKSQHNWFDMYLMSLCKHHIIANSSYSWWGAWLGNNPSKIVVAPEKWFAKEDVDYSNVVPESWIKI